MIRMDAENMLAGAANLKIQPGQYAGFLIRASGTNQAGQTLAVADLGWITAYYQGRPFFSVSFTDNQIINNIDLGLVEAASAIGAAFAFSTIIMASRVNDGNIFDISGADNAYVDVSLAGVTGALVAAGVIEIFGIPEEGTMMYLQQLFSNAPQIAAGGTDVLDLNYDNVSHLYFTAPTNLNQIQVDRDRVTMMQCGWADFIAFSNMDARLEAAFTTGARLIMQRSGALGEALSDNVKVTLTAAGGGAANPHIIAVCLDYTPDVLARSATQTQQTTEIRLRRKVDLGKSRPVTVAAALESNK